jgi:DNA repair photolyase
MKKLYKRNWLKEKPLYVDYKELQKNLGRDNFIFIGSSCDMWAENIEKGWIEKVLLQAEVYAFNRYLFQTKNPRRFWDFENHLDHINCDIGTTIETNRIYPCMGDTPRPVDRGGAIDALDKFNRFITIEPILDFDIGDFTAIIKNADPDYINIGADSGNNHLPEPEPEKIRELLQELGDYKINIKSNLKRLLPEVTV